MSAGPVKQLQICVVCGQAGCKYRCPQCRERYCSVSCCHQHKLSCGKNNETHSASTPSETNPSAQIQLSVEGEGEEEGILTDDQRERLSRSSWLQDTLKSKRLTDTIDGILDGTDRSAELKRCRQNPEFEAFVLRLLEEISG